MRFGRGKEGRGLLGEGENETVVVVYHPGEAVEVVERVEDLETTDGGHVVVVPRNHHHDDHAAEHRLDFRKADCHLHLVRSHHQHRPCPKLHQQQHHHHVDSLIHLSGHLVQDRDRANVLLLLVAVLNLAGVVLHYQVVDDLRILLLILNVVLLRHQQHRPDTEMTVKNDSRVRFPLLEMKEIETETDLGLVIVLRLVVVGAHEGVLLQIWADESENNLSVGTEAEAGRYHRPIGQAQGLETIGAGGRKVATEKKTHDEDINRLGVLPSHVPIVVNVNVNEAINATTENGDKTETRSETETETETGRGRGRGTVAQDILHLHRNAVGLHPLRLHTVVREVHASDPHIRPRVHFPGLLRRLIKSANATTPLVR